MRIRDVSQEYEAKLEALVERGQVLKVVYIGQTILEGRFYAE